MSRTAGITSSYTAHTIMADDLVAYQHEVPNAYPANVPLPWAETYDLNLNSGSRLTTLKQLIPDIDGDPRDLLYSLYYRTSREFGRRQRQYDRCSRDARRPEGPSKWLRRFPRHGARHSPSGQRDGADGEPHYRWPAFGRFCCEGRSLMAQPLPRTLQPPPELPSDPKTSDVLSQYLRTFALWCRHGFADKLSISTAAPGVMLQAYDAPSGTGAPDIHA